MNLSFISKIVAPVLGKMFMQETMDAIVSKVPSTDIESFILGTFTGKFETIRISIHGIKINMTDFSIRRFLKQVESHDWRGMIDCAVASVIDGIKN